MHHARTTWKRQQISLEHGELISGECFTKSKEVKKGTSTTILRILEKVGEHHDSDNRQTSARSKAPSMEQAVPEAYTKKSFHSQKKDGISGHVENY